jgi:hypothetical protein
MAFDYVVLKKAEDDLDEIIDYIAADNPKAALELYKTFLNLNFYLNSNFNLSASKNCARGKVEVEVELQV